jgi:dienelactone hydrolase
LFARPAAQQLQQEEQYDPAVLASSLPPNLPVLILRGTNDQNIALVDIQNLQRGFNQAGNGRVSVDELPGIDHAFRDVSGASGVVVDNASFPFSARAVSDLQDFLASAHIVP